MGDTIKQEEDYFGSAVVLAARIMAHAAQEQARRTEDHKEAVRAFLEKRQPDFKGR